MSEKRRIPRWRRILRIPIILTIIGIAYFIYFFTANKAPFLSGTVDRGIPYSKELKLDVYYPTKFVYEKSPLVIFIHGGGWIAGFKESINNNRFNSTINKLRDRGYTIITPNYTLARDGVSPFPSCFQDIYQVMDWVDTHADSLELDLNNVGLFGESAGAHIALMVAYAEANQFESNAIPFPIRYVVDVYGPTELTGIYHQETVDSMNAIIETLPEPIHSRLNITEQLFGFNPEVDSTRTANYLHLNSPYHYAHPNVPPTLIIQGDDDMIVPAGQSQLLHQALDSMGVETILYMLPGVNHGFIGATSNQRETLQQWIFDFIVGKYMEE